MRLMAASASVRAYLRVRMNFAIVFSSSSLTVPFGGIGIGPHTPVDPPLIFPARYASASLRDLCLAATSLYAGPTTFVSTWWQVRQFLSLRSCCASAANAAPLARASPSDEMTTYFMGSPECEKFRAMLRDFLRLGNLLDHCFQAIDRREAHRALAHPGARSAAGRLGEHRRQAARFARDRDHHGLGRIAPRELAAPALDLVLRTAQDHGARGPLVLLERSEQGRMPARALGQLGVELRERALGGERVARLAGKEVQSLQRECRDPVAGRRGVLVPRLGAMDQPLVVVAGEEEAASFLVLEPLEQHLGEVLGERERVGIEPGLDELEQRREQERVIVEIRVQVR